MDPTDGPEKLPDEPALTRVLALMQDGRVEAGFLELHRIIDVGEPDLSLRARMLLGRLEAARGQVDAGLAAYEKVAESGHVDLAPFAATMAAGLRLDRGEVALARAWLERAVASATDPEVAQAAAQALDALRPRTQQDRAVPG